MLGWIGVVILVILALGWTWMTFMANAMSDAPGAGFQGGWLLAGVWVVVLAGVLYKIFG